MSLPEESVAANTLPEVTTIPTGKKLIFTDPDTNEGGIITLENLSKQILQNLTSQTFALDQGNLTLLQALNQLNSKAFKIIENRKTYTITIKEYSNKIHRSIIVYGCTGMNGFFLIHIFINANNSAIAKKEIYNSSGRTFDISFDEETAELSISSEEHIWGGIYVINL